MHVYPDIASKPSSALWMATRFNPHPNKWQASKLYRPSLSWVSGRICRPHALQSQVACLKITHVGYILRASCCLHSRAILPGEPSLHVSSVINNEGGDQLLVPVAGNACGIG
jgi:hypothetical protein